MWTAVRNLPLLKDYQVIFAWKKGFARSPARHIDSDLKTFAEFIEGRHGVLLTAAQQDVAGFLEHSAKPRHRLALSCAQAELPARLLQVAAAGPPHPSRPNREY